MAVMVGEFSVFCCSSVFSPVLSVLCDLLQHRSEAMADSN